MKTKMRGVQRIWNDINNMKMLNCLDVVQYNALVCLMLESSRNDI